MGERRTAHSETETCFVLMVRSKPENQRARIIIESLRAFGGPLRDCPVWAFLADPGLASSALPDLEGVRRVPLSPKRGLPNYPFAEKVYACAQAEAMAGSEVRSLVWLSLDYLIVNPPLLFDLRPAPGVAEADAAFRPVHHRNIGSPADEPLDAFWQAVYRALEVEEMDYTVDSFVDGETLRSYLNSHCFAFNPAAGLAQLWWDHFVALVTDESFQAGPCSDALHRIFLLPAGRKGSLRTYMA